MLAPTLNRPLQPSTFILSTVNKIIFCQILCCVLKVCGCAVWTVVGFLFCDFVILSACL